MDSILELPFLDKVFLTNKILVARVRGTSIFLRASCTKENKKEYLKVTWYYNESSNPSLMDEYPFVDVLGVVGEEISEYLLFNMELFTK